MNSQQYLVGLAPLKPIFHLARRDTTRYLANEI